MGSLVGWFYLAYSCNIVGLSQSGFGQISGELSNCLTFYSISQIKEQGLASYPPLISLASFGFGLVLLLCGTTLIAVRKI